MKKNILLFFRYKKSHNLKRYKWYSNTLSKITFIPPRIKQYHFFKPISRSLSLCLVDWITVPKSYSVLLLHKSGYRVIYASSCGVVDVLACWLCWSVQLALVWEGMWCTPYMSIRCWNIEILCVAVLALFSLEGNASPGCSSFSLAPRGLERKENTTELVLCRILRWLPWPYPLMWPPWLCSGKGKRNFEGVIKVSN